MTNNKTEEITTPIKPMMTVEWLSRYPTWEGRWLFPCPNTTTLLYNPIETDGKIYINLSNTSSLFVGLLFYRRSNLGLNHRSSYWWTPRAKFGIWNRCVTLECTLKPHNWVQKSARASSRICSRQKEKVLATAQYHISYWKNSEMIRTVVIFWNAGAALFAKRKQKSEKWIVDENTVKQKAANAAAVAAAAVASEVNQHVITTTTTTVNSQQTRVEQTQKMASVQVVEINHQYF